MKRYIVRCDNCGKEHKSTNKSVKWNEETLGWNCVKCNIVEAVFTKSELQRMLEYMETNNKTAIVYAGYIADEQWIKHKRLN